MKFSDIEVGKWYWFHSDWHEHVVMGQAKEKISDVNRIIFNKVTNTDGSLAGWGPNDLTSKHITDIIKEIKKLETTKPSYIESGEIVTKFLEEHKDNTFLNCKHVLREFHQWIVKKL